MQDDPRSISHSRSRPSTGPHAHTNKATLISPGAIQTAMTQRTLRREERVPIRKPTKDGMAHRG